MTKKPKVEIVYGPNVTVKHKGTGLVTIFNHGGSGINYTYKPYPEFYGKKYAAPLPIEN